MRSIYVCVSLIAILISSCCQAQKNAAQIITKLTNNGTKEWYKCGTLSKSDRIPGDKRFVFSKVDMKFKIQTCNHSLQWETNTEYSWTIKRESDGSPPGYVHFNLLIDAKYAGFDFRDDYKTLFLKLPSWNEKMCLN